MGKDKKPAAPEPPVNVPLNQKAGRGHRQRGAGTVITAKAPVMTADGIVLRLHERLPSQLLHEYCQKEKRALPKYSLDSAKGGSKCFRVVLADAKNSKNDLEFCPNATFESDKVARDYAALLALYSLQRSIPLETKLPEPYRSSWLGMITGKGADGAAAPTSAAAAKPDNGRADSAPVPYETFKDKNTKLKAKEKELLAEKATADWLCDSCGVQNFATLATGATRTKCFKCQTPRGDDVAIVAGTGKASTGQVEKVVVKAPPGAVLDLQNKKKFSSQAESEKVDQEDRLHRKRKNQYFDAWRRSNRPSAILLPPLLRKVLEGLFGLSVAGESGEGAIVALDLDTVLCDVGQRGVVTVAQAEGGGCPGLLSLLPPSAQMEVARELAALLVKEGFSSGAVAAAIDSVARSPDLLLDDLCADAAAPGSAARAAERFGAALREALLEHLCLHTHESSLPATFDARSSETGRTLQLAAPSRSGATPPRLSYECLEECGWAAGDVLLARRALAGEQGEYGAAAAAALLSYALVEDGGCSVWWAGASADDAAAAAVAAAVEEEAGVLAAIYSDSFQRRTLQHSSGVPTLRLDVLSVDLPLPRAPSVRCALDMIVHAQSGYPELAPAFLLRCAGVVEGRLAAQAAVCAAAARWKGGAALFQAASYLQDSAASSGGGLLVVDDSGADSAQSRDGVSRRLRVLLGPQAAPEQVDLRVSDEVSVSATDEVSVSATDVESTISGSSGSKKSSVCKNKGGGASFWTRNKSQAAAAPPSKRYLEMLVKRKVLPAWAKRQEFLSQAFLAGHRAIVVTGETGCGKTTQIPQFILEERPGAKILVCQPRRLAAVGVATRVAEEMDQRLGAGAVGYMVRGDSRCSPQAQLAFCTYGVLLRRLQEDPQLEAVDYVVLDEIHERGVDSDFALALLMAAMGKRSDLTIIVMSATLSTDKFAKYIGAYSGAGCEPAPVMFIPGFTFPVSEYYKEAFEAAARLAPLEGVEDQYDEQQRSDRRAEEIGGRRWKGGLDYDLLVRLVLVLAGGYEPSEEEGAEQRRQMLRRAEGAVLIFVPGVPEISRLTQLLETHWSRSPGTRATVPRILSLHGGLSPVEQRRVFEPAPIGCLKVVVATNVAEASVTIPDVTVVVDTCKVRELDYDEESGSSALVTKLASQDSLRQRRGRAGRVSAGRCFRLITLGTYSKLPPHGVPEMLRTPIEGLVLQVKAMQQKAAGGVLGGGKGDGLRVLRRCPDPPQEASIAAAVAYLSQIQALAPNAGGGLLVTPLGAHLSSLPCSPAAGKLLLFGCILGSAFRCSAMVACMGARSPFLSPSDPASREAAARAIAAFATTGPRSDHLAQATAVERFSACVSEGDRRRFCREHWLSIERLGEIRDLQRDLLRACADGGFLESAEQGLQLGSEANRNHGRPRVAAAALCAGLYPNVARLLRPAKRFVETLGGNIERAVEARELQFFVPEKQSPSAEDYARISISAHTGAYDDICTEGLSRVFVHPSSLHAQNATFRASNFVLYGERSLSGSSAGSAGRAFIRDVTEASPFALLFFGGRVEVQYLQGTATLDKWIRFSAPGRLVALVHALRRSVDELLEAKLATPTLSLHADPHVAALCDILCSTAV